MPFQLFDRTVPWYSKFLCVPYLPSIIWLKNTTISYDDVVCCFYFGTENQGVTVKSHLNSILFLNFYGQTFSYCHRYKYLHLNETTASVNESIKIVFDLHLFCLCFAEFYDHKL